MPEGRPHIPIGSTPAAPAANRSLWGLAPILRLLPGQYYLGRVFVEVWDGNDQLVVPGNADSSLVARAGTALRGQHILLQGREVPGTNAAAGGTIANQIFLGRVIIELWSSDAVVGITGSDPRVLARARYHLRA
jgi:hypothetical protein